jgi:hypothetical protein
VSKASEYAERVAAAEQAPEPFMGKSNFAVRQNGEMWANGTSLTPSEALALADWIYETFGEEVGSE